MESDVEEGEIRESELLSPLSEDEPEIAEQNRLVLNPDPGPSRKRRRLDKRDGRRLPPAFSPPPLPLRRDEAHKRQPYYAPRDYKKRWKSGDSGKSHKSGASDIHSHSLHQNNFHIRKRNQSSEHRRDGRLSTELPVTSPRSTSSKSSSRHHNKQRKGGRDFEAECSQKNPVVAPLSIPAVTSTSNTNDTCDSKISPASPIIFEYESPLSPDNVIDTGRASTEPVKVTEEENEVELLSVIDKSNRVAELIVIDSTSSSESDENTDFEDPDQEKSTSPPLEAEVENSTVLVVTSAASSVPENAASPIVSELAATSSVTDSHIVPSAITATATFSSTFTTAFSAPATVEQPTTEPSKDMQEPPKSPESEDEDLEVIQLRIQALQGLIKNTSENASEVQSKNSKDMGKTALAVPDDSEKENDLELNLLRTKLLSDLAKKKKKTEAYELAKHRTETASRQAPCPSHPRHSTESRHSQTNAPSAIGTRRRSSHNEIRRNSNSVTTRSQYNNNKSKDARKSSNSRNRASQQPKKSTNSKSSAPTNHSPNKSTRSTLSVHVSKDGKERTVVKTSSSTSVVPITIEKPNNAERIVRIAETPKTNTSPTKAKKVKSTAATKPINVICTSGAGPLKILPKPSPVKYVKTTIPIKPVLPRIPPPPPVNNDGFNITRTIVNTNAYKSKFQTKKSYNHILKRTSTGKKIQPIVIPLRDNDKSTEEEDSEEEPEKNTTPVNGIALPDSFHSSLDKFLKSVREQASFDETTAALQNKTTESSPVEAILTKTPESSPVAALLSKTPESFPVAALPSKSPESSPVAALPSKTSELSAVTALLSKTSELSPVAAVSLTSTPLASPTLPASVPSLIQNHLASASSLKKVDTARVPPPLGSAAIPASPISKSDTNKTHSPTKTSPQGNVSVSQKSNSPPKSNSATGAQTSTKAEESLVDQVTRTREELQLREKLLRATFKNREIKLKLTRTEQDFLIKRQTATSMLASAIDQINQHSEKREQCNRTQKQVEKLQKQLELAKKGLFAQLKEESRLHNNAITAVQEAFEMRAKSVSCGTQCKQLGQELSGEQYKVPSQGAGELLTKVKEIYKLTTHEELKKGPINFKTLEKQIITSFTGSKVSEPEPSTATSQRSGNLMENSGKVDESALKIYNSLAPPGTDGSNWRVVSVMSYVRELVPNRFTPYESPLRCLTQTNRSFDNCDAIICKYYVLGGCTLRDCKYQHL